MLLVAEYYGLGYVIVGRGKKLVKGTVYLVVLARLYLYGQHCETGVVVYEKIYLTALLVVVVVQGVAVGVQLLCHRRLVHCSQVYAAYVAQHGVYVGAVQQHGEQPHVA